MTRVIRTILTSILALTALSAIASVADLPVTNINGKIYHYYRVERKESIYSVLQKLGVSKDDLLTYNPSAREGLKEGMTLYFPYSSEDAGTEAPATAQQQPVAMAEDVDAAPAGSHLVKRGETIYSLARRYGVTEADIHKWNPNLKNEGLKADTYIIVAAPADAPESTAPAQVVPATAAESSASGTHVVKEKETFYSIARHHGITVPELEAANPDITLLKPGMVLQIPLSTPADEATATEIAASNSDVADASGQETETSDNVDTPDETSLKESINIGLILPFMTGQEPLSKPAQRFTEFYKGFLVAVDSMRSSRKPVNITAFDSHASTDTVKAILRLPELKDMDVVIAPDNAAQLAYIARWGLENNVKVFNSFVIKDDSYTGNPMMLQSNIPSELMLDKAAEYLVESLDGATPVILSPKVADDDKADFLKELSDAMAAHNITPVTIEYEKRLTPASLAALDATASYVFIPTTGKQAEVNKILPALIEWHRVSPTATIRVWGYPEWIAFLGETLQNMHALNTTIYSRFAPYDEENYRNRKFDATFKHWYGTEMENATPRQGLLGFDTGMFLLRMLLLDDPTPARTIYTGIQNDFNFSQEDNGGWVNESLTFVNYRPGGTIHNITK